MDRIIRLLLASFSLIAGLWLAPMGAHSEPNAQPNTSKIRRILMPLEGFLVSRVPARYRYDFDYYFTISIDGENVHFGVRPDAIKFLVKLRAEGIELHFMSSLDKATTKRMTDTIRSYLYYFDNEMSARTLSREDFRSGRLALSALPGGAKEGDLIATVSTLNVARADRERTFDTGRLFYLFSSFNVAKENRRTARKNAAKFPKNETEWKVDNQRLAGLYFYVNRRNAGVLTGKSLDEVSRSIGLPANKITEFGRDLLLDRVKPDEYAWGTANGKMVCNRVEVMLNKRREEPLASCLANLPVNYEFEAAQDGVTVSKCVARSADEGRKLIPVDLGLDACLKGRSAEFAWESRERVKCASYVPSPKGRGSLRLRDEESARCTDRFVKVLRKDGRIVVFTAFDGWESLPEAELDKRVSAPKPNEENLERLWDAEDDSDERGVDLATCMDDNNDRGYGYDGKKYGHMKEGPDRQLLPQCRPDTLYSWGDEQKFKTLRGLMSGDTWQKIRPIYATPGAVTTFNYGPIPLRIKLKPGVKFKATESHYSCGYGGEVTEEQRETVYYRKDVYKDWVICSTDVIESWSHSLPQHYDEIIKDLRDHRRRPGPENVIYYYYLQNDKKTIFTDDYLDGRSGFTEKVLKGFLQQFVQRVRENKGEIFYNPKTPSDRRTIEQHFKTDRPLYFNQR